MDGSSTAARAAHVQAAVYYEAEAAAHRARARFGAPTCEISITIQCTHAYEDSWVRETGGQTKVDDRTASTIETVLKRVVAGYPINVTRLSIQHAETCGVFCLCADGLPPSVQDALTTGLKATLKGLTHVGEEDIHVQYGAGTHRSLEFDPGRPFSF